MPRVGWVRGLKGLQARGKGAFFRLRNSSYLRAKTKEKPTRAPPHAKMALANWGVTETRIEREGTHEPSRGTRRDMRSTLKMPAETSSRLFYFQSVGLP